MNGNVELRDRLSVISAIHRVAKGPVVDPVMARVMERAERFRALPWPVLIQGETGTGKEFVARAVAGTGPLVAINAAALCEGVLQSELFGHERGAFTGACGVKRGVFEQADGGTLFLDEVGELPLTVQASLLRVLEEGRFRRVGGEGEVRARFRLVCATHRDLRQRCGEGYFREDLFFRLARLRLALPPLRERPRDVVSFARMFLRECEVHCGERRWSDGALAALLLHPWPGNLRELKNVVTQLSVEADQPVIDGRCVRAMLAGPFAAPARTAQTGSLSRVVELHRGNVSAAARSLGMSRSTLRSRLHRKTVAE